jgi:hypothetical protein
VWVLQTGKHTFFIWKLFFNALGTNGLTINLEKCVFAVPSLEILGHTISATLLALRQVMPPT